MTTTLNIIGAFVFGLMLGGGIIGALIGWGASSDAYVVRVTAEFFVHRRHLLAQVVALVDSARPRPPTAVVGEDEHK